MVMKRGGAKCRSVRQEDYIAKRLGGARSPSSGGAASDQGDVRTHNGLYLVECKVRGQYDKPAKSISISMADLAKITDEAWSEGREPLMALRVIDPDHRLADRDGHVDLIVCTLDHWMDPRYT